MSQASAGVTADVAAPEGSMLRRFGRTSFLAFGLQVGGVGISYFANLLAARIAGPDNYGLYAYVTAVIVIISYFAALGYDSAMLRFLPVYAERGAQALVAGMIRYVESRVKWIAGGIALLSLTLAVIVLTATGQRLGAQTETFVLGSILIPIWTLIFIRSATVRALGNVLIAQLPERILRDGGLAVLVALFALSTSRHADAQTLVICTIISGICALAFISHMSRRLSRPHATDTCSITELEAWRRAAYPFLAMVAAEALINRCGVLLLGLSGRTADAGSFALVSNLACLVMLPRLAVNAYLTPMIAKLYERRDMAALQLIVSRGALWSFLGALSIGIGVWITSEMLLRWYGPTFVDGRAALGVLIVGQTIAASAGAQLQLLKMTGREVSAAIVLITSLLTYIVLGLILIPSLGLMGAALANLGCQLAWNLSMLPIVRRHLGIRPGIFRLPALIGP